MNPPPEPGLEFSIARLEALFSAKDWYYALDSDGDLRAIFDHYDFIFAATGRRGELMHVRCRWNIVAPFDAREQLLDACNDWNRTKLFPKAYVGVEDDGDVLTFGEFVRDYELGVTDPALAYDVEVAVNTSLLFFDFLNERFPETRFQA
ncbi:YbjN domain-containing protein [Corynebacterium sp. SCR221107]|uniref:YbjN domain-containing protein n=1 Tax=Corynebacterium sp. SCR221107 TaxID=3017361 RepID=UPI0022EC1C51|nr:YbjN domain-containing protein [Corynebacterium sp. SCR221107]WBT08474.1 YbjN domain-containing protein [Corynebacterium sp. SCR221107]